MTHGNSFTSLDSGSPESSLAQVSTSELALEHVAQERADNLRRVAMCRARRAIESDFDRPPWGSSD